MVNAEDTEIEYQLDKQTGKAIFKIIKTSLSDEEALELIEMLTDDLAADGSMKNTSKVERHVHGKKRLRRMRTQHRSQR